MPTRTLQSFSNDLRNRARNIQANLLPRGFSQAHPIRDAIEKARTRARTLMAKSPTVNAMTAGARQAQANNDQQRLMDTRFNQAPSGFRFVDGGEGVTQKEVTSGYIFST